MCTSNQLEEKLKSMSDSDLNKCWNALAKQVLEGMYDENLTLVDWAEFVYSELSRRHIKAA